jgi:hypothetical protein
MEKLEDQLMSAPGKLQRGMRWPFKFRKGPRATPHDARTGAWTCGATKVGFEPKMTDAADCLDDGNAREADLRYGLHESLRFRQLKL